MSVAMLFHENSKVDKKPVEKPFNAHMEIPFSVWYTDLCHRIDECKTLEELDKFDASDFQNKKKRQRELNAKADMVNSLPSSIPVKRVKAQQRTIYDYQSMCYIEQTRLLDGSNRRMQRKMPRGFKPRPVDFTWHPVMANISDHNPVPFWGVP